MYSFIFTQSARPVVSNMFHTATLHADVGDVFHSHVARKQSNGRMEPLRFTPLDLDLGDGVPKRFFFYEVFPPPALTDVPPGYASLIMRAVYSERCGPVLLAG